MNKKFKFITGIILITITGIVGMAGWFLYHLISNEKERQGRGYEQVITDAKDKLSMQSSRKDCRVGYDIKAGSLYYYTPEIETYITVGDSATQYWIHTAPIYDIRDTSRWTLKALNELIQEDMLEKEGYRLNLEMQVTDSTGRVLQTWQEGKVEEGLIHHFEEPLGYLTPHTLSVTFQLPPGSVWRAIAQDVFSLSMIAVLLVICLLLLLQYFRTEKKNAEIRNFYMRMYRHDLRVPIGSITTHTQLLQAELNGRLNAEEKMDFADMETDIARVHDGIEQMIGVQVCEHSLRMPFKKVDVHELLAGLAKERWRGKRADNGNGIRTDLQAENPVVYGDKDLLATVFLNLMDNALKYGGPDVEVCLSTRETQQDRMEVVVEDNGPGIPAEARGRIFERDFRLKRDREHLSGTGWGLFMVRRIVEAHGGDIRTEERTGGGSRFVIHLKHKRLWILR